MLVKCDYLEETLNVWNKALGKMILKARVNELQLNKRNRLNAMGGLRRESGLM